MGPQVTLHDGTIATVTPNNYGALAAQESDAQGFAPGSSDAHAVANAFRQLAGYNPLPTGTGFVEAPDNAPGQGNAFWAGVETLFSNPTAFVQDLTGHQDQNNYTPSGAPGNGNSFLAGLETLFMKPAEFFKDLPGVGDLPGSGSITTWLVLGTISILGIAYISHKVL